MFSPTTAELEDLLGGNQPPGTQVAAAGGFAAMQHGWCSDGSRHVAKPWQFKGQMAVENHHFSWENPLVLSIAILNYQRVLFCKLPEGR